jgi:glyoxylase-like metal-dependent hydrolase (beta-lactamase superfamily II)
VTDALDGVGVEERVRALGEPAAVVQLLDRHGRDCATVARRLGVPLHVTPFDGVDGAPFEVLPVLRWRRWQEVALWFPAERILAVGDALGTADYFLAGDEPLAVHPLLRLAPPRKALAGLEPLHVLCGHGPGVHGERVPEAVREALATARRRLPQAWLSGLRAAVRRSAA